MLLGVWNTCLLAQRPIYTTRLFSPVDTTVTNFITSLPGTQPILLSDSSVLTLGSLNTQRLFSRFDKQGSLVWSRTYRSDSSTATGWTALPTGEIFLVGQYLSPTLDTFNRLFVAKLNVNGTPGWTTVFNVPQPAGLTGANVLSTNIAVSSSGAIMVAGVSGSTSDWKSHCVLLNPDGAIQRAWTYDTLQRPFIYPNLDGGFLLALGRMVNGMPSSLAQTFRVSWLNAQGDEYRQFDLGHSFNATIGSPLLRIAPIGDADSSLAIVHVSSVSRMTKSGQLLWAKNRSYAATPGVTFNTNSSLINASLAVSNQNKIWIASSLFESNFGTGPELPVINEYDVATGALRARVLAYRNGRASSLTPFLNGAGFWIAVDTVIPVAANQTRVTTSRWIRADTSLNGGCGAPILLNSQTSNALIRVLPVTPNFTRIPFPVQGWSARPLVAPTEILVTRKGECPESIVGTDEITKAQINVFPNPSAADFNVDALDATIQTIRVFDSMGRIVQQIECNQSQITINALQAGTYFLHIQTNKGLVVKKVVQFSW